MKHYLFAVLISCSKLLASERCDISSQITKTKECVAKFSQDNSSVQEVYLSLASELNQAYIRGEGFIDKDVCKILEAVSFAAEKHQSQTRKDPAMTPYIIHPMRVAKSLLVVGGVRDPDILIAALLHDTVEDTATTFEEIRSAFGPKVEGYLREVTDDKSLEKDVRKQLQIQHAPHKSAGAAMIKLGDKNDNLTSMGKELPVGWTNERLKAYFVWAQKVVNALPWVNAPLKKQVDQTISSFFEAQKVTKE
jgi:(p)ppGpp synthase/HD superfamily hydrolase